MLHSCNELCPAALPTCPAVIPGTLTGCAVNLGAGNVPGYRRCVSADVSQGAGRQMQLASSLRVLNNQLVLSGALLLPNYACTLGPSGWVGFGLPQSQASTRQMFGARVFVAQPEPGAPTGEQPCRDMPASMPWPVPNACLHACLRACGIVACCWSHAVALLLCRFCQPAAAIRIHGIKSAAAPNHLAGASVAAFSLQGTSPYQFYPPTGLLARAGALR